MFIYKMIKNYKLTVLRLQGLIILYVRVVTNSAVILLLFTRCLRSNSQSNCNVYVYNNKLLYLYTKKYILFTLKKNDLCIYIPIQYVIIVKCHDANRNYKCNFFQIKHTFIYKNKNTKQTFEIIYTISLFKMSEMIIIIIKSSKFCYNIRGTFF